MTSKRQLEDWLDGYLSYTSNSEPPSMYRLWTGISVIAACLRRKCVMNWGTLDIYPNMYIVLVGPSGRCRKGTAMSQGMFFLREMGIKLAAESITREALIRELKESFDTQIDPNTNQMHMHASLTIYSQELTVFLGYNNLPLMSDLTDWFDCRDVWVYRTKHMGTDEIQGVWVNLIGATTPDLIKSTLPRDAIGGGLTSRMIFVFEPNKEKTVVSPFLSADDMIMQKKLMDDLQQVSVMAGKFTVTDEFIDRWVPWYEVYDKTPPPFNDDKFAGYFERRPMHLLKLSTIMSASRSNSMKVTDQDFDRAMRILDETERKMAFAFTGYGANPAYNVMESITKVIQRRGVVAYDELLKMYRHEVDRYALDRIVDTLKAYKAVRVEYAGNDQRLLHFILEDPKNVSK